MKLFNFSKERHIPLFIFLTPIMSVIFTAIIILFVMYMTLNDFYNQQKMEIKQNFFHELKYNTQKRVEIAYSVLDTIYHDKKDKNATLHEFRKLLDTIRWGKGGYIFVYDFKGNTIYHPNHSLIGKNRWNLKRGDTYVLRYLTEQAIKKPNGTYVEYMAYNPDGGKPLRKVSYLKVYRPLNIFIGSGVYLNELNKELLKKQDQFKELFSKLVFKILSVSFLVVLIVLFITALISFYVKKIFKDYEKALKKEKDKLFEESITDKLTGLYNRRYFSNQIKQYISLADRENKKLAVLYLDLDNFKDINDTKTHQVGDYILKVIAERLKSILRKYDTVARFGGDEFVISILGFNEIEDIEVIVQKIIDVIKQPIYYNNKEKFEISSSIGIALYPKDGKTVGELIKNADAAMYKAKKDKSIFEFFTKEINEEFQKRVELKQALKEGIKNKEFIPYFQPQIDINENLYGSETLVRWKRGDKIVYPNEFIDYAIEIGLIDEIDKIVIENSIIQWKKWELLGHNPGVLSCNITMHHIEKTDFIAFIEGILKRYDFNPKNFSLEITEQSVMNNPQESIKIFKKIKKLGIGINIDDFGTGYSSLSYLKKLPVDKLKIDKSFIDGIPFDQDDVKITKTIISLAKGFNLKIVAEGVETKIQRDFLIQNGCDYIQGYYYSKPLNAEEFEKRFLKDNDGSE
ncbi:EAL domain-containing protein [Caminibacter sp.]